MYGAIANIRKKYCFAIALIFILKESSSGEGF